MKKLKQKQILMVVPLTIYGDTCPAHVRHVLRAAKTCLGMQQYSSHDGREFWVRSSCARLLRRPRSVDVKQIHAEICRLRHLADNSRAPHLSRLLAGSAARLSKAINPRKS